MSIKKQQFFSLFLMISLCSAITQSFNTQCMLGEKENTAKTTCAPEEEDICPICQDDEEKLTKSDLRLKCGHKFHTKCINNWIITCQRKYKRPNCPYCRREIKFDHNGRPKTMSDNKDHVNITNNKPIIGAVIANNCFYGIGFILSGIIIYKLIDKSVRKKEKK